MPGDTIDPKGLIRESYLIDGIRPEECRSVFLDWALSLPDEQTVATAIPELLTRHAADHPDHPMNAVLRDGLSGAGATPQRRGGHAARVPPES